MVIGVSDAFKSIYIFFTFIECIIMFFFLLEGQPFYAIHFYYTYLSQQKINIEINHNTKMGTTHKILLHSPKPQVHHSLAFLSSGYARTSGCWRTVI